MDQSVAEPFQTATDIIARAHANLSAQIWDYVCGAAESETTKRRNRDSLDEWAFRPRVLRNVAAVEASTTLLQTPLRIPILLAPVGSLQTIVEGGALQTVKAAAAFGTLAVISSSTQPSIEETAQAAAGDKWYQLYIRGDLDWIAAMVGRIRDAGYRALVLTVDAPWYSIRERQMRHNWQPPSLSGQPALEYQALLDWDMVARIRDRARLPIVLKGIQTVEDAEAAVKLGIDVVWLSNHGGRHPDHARGGLHVLAEVVEGLGDKVPLVVDGGFLRGTDVMKALALGAKAVAIGRLQAYALGAGGAPALVRLLEILENEIRTGMAMIGATALAQFDRSSLARLGPPSGVPKPFPLLADGINY
jgi:glycolate oxidase